MFNWLRTLFSPTVDEGWFEMTDEKFLVAGLGNPGKKYRGNRHNIGFMAVDRLANSLGITSNRVEQRAIVAKTTLADKPLIIVKPQTFMNSSGDAIGALATYYKIPAQNVLVIYDELDLPFGTIRLRSKGGANGHNGMKSIINHLGQEFPRVRLGIGRPPGKMPVHAYVLQDFKGQDTLITLDLMLDETVKAVETWLRDGIDMAMSRHNKVLS